MSKHNLIEYGLAKEAIEDLPIIKKELDSCFKLLYKYQDYLAASYVLDAISESLHLIDRQYKAAKKVIEEKGRIF
jgi:hypothetical protein